MPFTDKELVAVRPHLIAFARSMCGSCDYADDLTQETLMKAVRARESFKEGSNLRAWCFVILRNQFLTERRRDRHRMKEAQLAALAETSTYGNQEAVIELAELHEALDTLPPSQREAVLLVGRGESYEEVAALQGVEVGTIKSRVARGRHNLQVSLNANGSKPTRSMAA